MPASSWCQLQGDEDAYVFHQTPTRLSINATKALSSTFFHRPRKTKPQDRFQRQDANAVRARTKATYHADPEKAKVINAAWYAEHPEKRREHVKRWWREISTGQTFRRRTALRQGDCTHDVGCTAPCGSYE